MRQTYQSINGKFLLVYDWRVYSFSSMSRCKLNIWIRILSGGRYDCHITLGAFLGQSTPPHSTVHKELWRSSAKHKNNENHFRFFSVLDLNIAFLYLTFLWSRLSLTRSDFILLCVTFVQWISFQFKLTWIAFGLSQLTLFLITFDWAFSLKHSPTDPVTVELESREVNENRRHRIMLIPLPEPCQRKFNWHCFHCARIIDHISIRIEIIERRGMKFMNLNRHANHEPRSRRKLESQSFKFSIEILRTATTRSDFIGSFTWASMSAAINGNSSCDKQFHNVHSRYCTTLDYILINNVSFPP